MQEKSKKLFEKIFKESKDDPNIIGFWLDGSMGKGMVTKKSDYDLAMVVRDGLGNKYRKRYKFQHVSGVDIKILSFSEFEKYAEWGSNTSWDRYNFAHLKTLIDKNGKIQKLINEKGIIPRNKIKIFIDTSLDAYINRVYRSFKCLRDKNDIAGKLEAAESIFHLLDALFALEGRIRPYHKYLFFELEKFPLKEIPFGKNFLKNILEILETGNRKMQKEMLKKVKEIFKRNGYGQVINSWDGYFELI